MKTTHVGILGAMIVAGLAGLSVAADPVVLSPDDETATVTRTEGDLEGSVTYVVERRDGWIKFEDAEQGLGEDGAIQTDTFVMHVAGAGDTVHVKTKAGRYVAEWVSGDPDEAVDENGFHIELVSIEDGVYTIRLSSTEEVTYALSHVEFTFFPGERATAMYD